MARSSYIYVVCHDFPRNMDAPHIIAAFTVKHEMITWMERCNHQHKSAFTVYRVKDNDYTKKDKSEITLMKI